MKVWGLDGRQHSLRLVEQQRGNASNLHILARDILAECFPFEKIFEEVPLIGCSPILYCDFLLLSQMLIFEVQGQQHTEYTPFFHKTKLEFFKAKARDTKKREWIKLNNFTLIELPYDNTDEWRTIIECRGKIKTSNSDS